MSSSSPSPCLYVLWISLCLNPTRRLLCLCLCLGVGVVAHRFSASWTSRSLVSLRRDGEISAADAWIARQDELEAADAGADRAALYLQAAARGASARRDVSRELDAKHRAATRMQAISRGKSTRSLSPAPPRAAGAPPPEAPPSEAPADDVEEVTFTATLSEMRLDAFDDSARAAYASGVAAAVGVPEGSVTVVGARAGSVVVETAIAASASDVAAIVAKLEDPSIALVDEATFGTCAVSAVGSRVPGRFRQQVIAKERDGEQLPGRAQTFREQADAEKLAATKMQAVARGRRGRSPAPTPLEEPPRGRTLSEVMGEGARAPPPPSWSSRAWSGRQVSVWFHPRAAVVGERRRIKIAVGVSCVRVVIA